MSKKPLITGAIPSRDEETRKAKSILNGRSPANKVIVCNDDSEDITAGIRELAVVIGPPARARSQELMLFKKLRHFHTVFVNSTNVRKFLPEFSTKFLLSDSYSTAGFFKLRSFEERLKNVDVINCIELYPFISHQCADIAKKEKKKLAVNVFETIVSIPFHYVPPFSSNVKSVLKQTDAFIAYTNRAREYLLHLSASSEKIEVVYPGIDLQAFSPPNKHTHESFRILFVGRLSHEKGLSFILKAFSRLYASNRNTELWICGSGQRGEKEEYLAQTMARKYPIKILGHVEHNNLPNVYRECDLLCLPSLDEKKLGIKVWEEQFGFVLIEAMACGLPIVATNCGAIPEVIGSENIVVPQKSANALYLAFRRLTEDDRMCKNMSRANRARAETLFDINRQREKLDRVLVNCCNEEAG